MGRDGRQGAHVNCNGPSAVAIEP
ncbi:MAG: hypothetical protein QOH53_979, partial [Ilumatobacteraceae bacterium]